MLEIATKVLLSLLSLVGVALVPLGLPGLFLTALVGLGAVLSLDYPWLLFWLLLGAAVLGEVLDFFISLGTAKKAGAGKPGMIGAFLGGLIGGVAGTPLMPLIGTLIGAAFGALVGAFVFEFALAKRDARASLKAGGGAFLGVLIARVMKVWLGLAQAALLILTLLDFIDLA